MITINHEDQNFIDIYLYQGEEIAHVFNPNITPNIGECVRINKTTYKISDSITSIDTGNTYIYLS